MKASLLILTILTSISIANAAVSTSIITNHKNFRTIKKANKFCKQIKKEQLRSGVILKNDGLEIEFDVNGNKKSNYYCAIKATLNNEDISLQKKSISKKYGSDRYQALLDCSETINDIKKELADKYITGVLEFNKIRILGIFKKYNCNFSYIFTK